MNNSNILTGLVTALLLSACGGGNGDGPVVVKTGCSWAKLTPVDFGQVFDAELNTAYMSNEVTISGLASGCTRNIFGDIVQSYSINGGPFTDKLDVVRNGDRVRLRHVSPSIYGSTSFWIILDDGFHVSTRPGKPADAPIVTILSPTDQATVHASRIIVSGVATDPDDVALIEITGSAVSAYRVAATSTDGFATWQAEIPLVSGTNVLTVKSVDGLNNINPLAAEISIDNQATVLAEPKAIESDISNQRLLVVDQTLHALLAIDLVTGHHSVLSDENTPDATTPFTEPRKLVVNFSGTTAWVIDDAYDDIIQVDLATGARSLLVDTVGTAAMQPVSGATDFVLDEVNGRLVLLMGEDETALVLSLDLASGARIVLSDADTPDTNNPFGTPKSLALDTINNRLLVAQRNHANPVFSGDALLAIDPTTGLRVLIVDDTVLTNNPVDADFDIDNGRVLILTTLGIDYRAIILTFDLASDELTTLFSNHSSHSIQITRDPLNNRLLVLYDNSNSIGAIDLATGEASIAY